MNRVSYLLVDVKQASLHPNILSQLSLLWLAISSHLFAHTFKLVNVHKCVLYDAFLVVVIYDSNILSPLLHLHILSKFACLLNSFLSNKNEYEKMVFQRRNQIAGNSCCEG